MGKNKSIIFCIFLFVTILIVLLVIPVSAAEKPITLTLAIYSTPQDLSGKIAIMLQEEIAKKTDGRVNLKIYWAGSLLKGAEILRGVADGIADMGNINPNYYPKQLPISQAFNVIFKGPNEYKSQMMIYKKVMEQIPEWKGEYLAYNQIPLYSFVYSHKAIVSTKPLASFEDLKNQKIRSSSRWLLAMIEAAGAIPVSIPWPDCYMALQTGTTDAVLTNFDSIHCAKLDEIAQNILLTDLLWAKGSMFFTINLDTWDILPEDIQSQMMEALDSITAPYSKLVSGIWDKYIEEAEEMGCIINSLSAEDMEKWVSLPAAKEIEKQWVKEAEDAGMENARDKLEKIKSIVAEVEEMNNQ